MKIRFIHQFFHPDLSATSRMLSQLAFHLAAEGDDVSVICSRNRYVRMPGDRLPSRERMHGVDVLRVWGPSLPRRFLAGRGLNILSFCILASVRAMLSPRAEAVVFMTDPPFFPILGAALKRVRKERFIQVMMDVYPDVAVKAGVLREGSVITRLLRRISTRALRAADRVLVLGDDMREVAIRSGADPEKVVVARNWADPEAIRPVDPGENRLRRAWGLEGKFVVAYSGNLGVPHAFDDILAVARELRSDDGIRFLFIGGGKRLRELWDAVDAGGLENVVFKPYQAMSDLSESLSAGDVHYVSLRDGFEGLVVPSKAYGIMAAGRPIIYQGNASGEIARMVASEGIGVVVRTGDRAGLRRAILDLHRDHGKRRRLGETARNALIEKYSAARSLAMFRDILAGSARPAGPERRIADLSGGTGRRRVD